MLLKLRSHITGCTISSADTSKFGYRRRRKRSFQQETAEEEPIQ